MANLELSDLRKVQTMGAEKLAALMIEADKHHVIICNN